MYIYPLRIMWFILSGILLYFAIMEATDDIISQRLVEVDNTTHNIIISNKATQSF